MDKAMHWAIRLRHTRALTALRRVLATLWPLVLLGGWAAAINQSVLARGGFFAQIYHIASWLPGFNVWHQGFELLTGATLGLLGLASTVVMAAQVARAHRELAGLVAGASFLVLHALPGHNGTGISWVELGERGVIFGLLLGAFVGWFVPRAKPIWRTAAVLIASAGWRLLSLLVIKGTVLGWLASATLPLAVGRHATLGGAVVICFDHLFSFFGLPTSNLAGTDTTQAAANLSAALSKGLAHVPYRLTLGTVYTPFATFGGLGATLGLVIAMLILNYRRRQAWALLGPSLVNVAGPVLFGVPVLAEPVLLIPYLLAPLGSALIAWVTLALRWMVPAVYQVPPTTPGPLQAWLATNGSWPALLVSLLCLAWSIAIYLPFVQILRQEKAGERHA